MSSILIDTAGTVGYLTLARPGGLNALSLDMIQDLHSGLNRHLDNAEIHIVCLRSADPKAFCAGGDMKRIRELVLRDELERVEAFFRAEYMLNQAIAESDKPVVALVDGLAMGGGLGLSMHARYSVVTPQARLAMPEVRIGFFPDVGGTWFLPRLSGAAGYWLGMTGAAIDADMAVACGLADVRIPGSRIEAVNQALRGATADTLGAILQAEAVPPPPPPLLAHYEQWFEGRTARAALAALAAAERNRYQPESVRAAAAAAMLQLHQASPHSLLLIEQLFDHERTRSLAECLARELAASGPAARHPDLAEGVRAVLVDKDHKPHWVTR